MPKREAEAALMEVIPTKKSRRVKKEYAKGPIPYEVSQPKRFWRIQKDLPPEIYWKKRYWRRRITGRGSYYVPRPKRLRGRGDYNILGKGGAWLGAKLGGYAGNAIGQLIGLGDYTIKKNVFTTGQLPEVVNLPGGGGTVIRFQEYLGDIVTSSSANTYNAVSYYLNPANEATFPWLSQIAANYEEYEFEGLMFCFNSTSADALNSTNTALGTVMMATQYDVLDSAFQGKLDLLNYQGAQSTVPSKSMCHFIECDPRQTSVSTMLYTLPGSVPSGADARLYHLGVFTLATTGFQGTSVNCGELHVTYQVRLMKPKMYASLGNSQPSFAYQNSTGIAAATPLGTVANATLSGPNGGVGALLGITMVTDQIIWPATIGKLYYRWAINWSGTSATFTVPAITYNNCANVGVINAPQTTATATSCTISGVIQTNAALGSIPSITLAHAGSFPTGTVTVTVIQMPQNSANMQAV